MTFFAIKNPILIAFCVNIISFSHGTVLGWVSPFISLLQSESTPLKSGPISIVEVSWIVSIISFGSFTSSLSCSFLTGIWGRKKSLLSLGFITITSWIIVIFATDVNHLYIARLVAGLTGGGIYSIIPLYIAEIAEPKNRGALGSIFLFNYNSGMLFSYIISLFFDYYTFSYIMLCVPIIFICIFSCFPETPQFLLAHNRTDAAEKSLKFYRGLKENEELTASMEKELERMKFVNAMKKLIDTRLKIKYLTSKEAIHGLIISNFLMILNQLSGGLTILNYCANIFRDSGSDIDPNISTIAVGTAVILGAYGSTILSDRCGRKILLIISMGGQCLGLAALGYFSYLAENNYDVTSFNFIPVIVLTFVLFIGGLGVITISFVVIVEVLPKEIRTFGSNISMCVLCATTFTVLKMFPIFNEKYHLSCCMWIFSGSCFIGTLFIIFVVPETKGKILDTLSEETIKDVTTQPNNL